MSAWFFTIKRAHIWKRPLQNQPGVIGRMLPSLNERTILYIVTYTIVAVHVCQARLATPPPCCCRQNMWSAWSIRVDWPLICVHFTPGWVMILVKILQHTQTLSIIDKLISFTQYQLPLSNSLFKNLTHLPLVPYICVSELSHHWVR